MQLNRSTCRSIAVGLVLLLATASASVAQVTCERLTSATTEMPNFSGQLPVSGDMTTGGGTSHLYVLTQWGFARTPISNHSNPSPYTAIVIGNEGGSGSGGIIPIMCDCHKGGNTMDAAQGPNGDSRIVSDWQPYAQGGDPGDSGFSGLPAMVAMTTGGGTISFGQQISLPDSVAASARIAAIYTGSKYFAYFPVRAQGVFKADVTSPTGSASGFSPIVGTFEIGWNSGTIPGRGARLSAKHISASSFSGYVLVGSTIEDSTVRIGEINPTTGDVDELATAGTAGPSSQVEVAVISNRIFVFSAEGSAGLRVYEFVAPSSLSHVATISGDYRRLAVRGPALFAHRYASGSATFIEVYNADLGWIVGSDDALLALSIPHYQASDEDYQGAGFEAFVEASGSTAYLHRAILPAPPGLPVTEPEVHTTKLDVSCIAGDPTAPPDPVATMTNLSAAARPSPENTKNYHGDKWELKDSSVSFLEIGNVEWDIRTGASGPFNPDAAWSGNPGSNPELSNINPAYWPCDPGAGGNLAAGTGCWASLGSPQGGTFHLGLRTSNANCLPPSTCPVYFSPGVAVLAPNVTITGFNGTVLQVLAGNPNNGNASASQGNTAEASFAWSFTCSPACGSLNGTIVTIPTAATAFSLVATYKDGFQVTKSGPIQQVDLVPNASVSPNPVLTSSTLTAKNLMQKAVAATLNSVTWQITPGGGSGTLAASFLPLNGTAGVTVPGTTGSYSLTLTYFFTDHNGAAQSAGVSVPFQVTDFVPVPVLGVYKNSNKTNPVPPIAGVYNLVTNTTYYLFDEETIPGGNHPGAKFYRSNDSNQSISPSDTQILPAGTGAGPTTHNSGAACATNCYIKVEVSGAVRAFKIVVAGGGGGGCEPNCPETPDLTLTGPISGNVNIAVQFTAVATNFPGAITWTWTWGDEGGGGGGGGGGEPCPPILHCDDLTVIQKATAVDGTSTQPHTYTATGSRTVTVRAQSGSTSITRTRSISIGTGGPPPPSNDFTVTGATFNGFSSTWEAEAGHIITFTAVEPDPAATFVWDFGDGSTSAGRTVTHAFATEGNRMVGMMATGGGTLTEGTNFGSENFRLSPPTFQALMIPGAGSILSEAGDWATDFSITNPGTQATTITLYFASFADVIPDNLSELPWDSLDSFRLDAGQSWSGIDVVGDPEILNRRGSGKGILFARFEGGNELPIATTRVYFTSEGSSFGTALPSFVTGPFGQTGAQSIALATGQTLVGLRNDSLYRFNVSLFNASSEGGSFRLNVYDQDGAEVANRNFSVPPYSQAGVNDTDLFTPDPAKRYVLKATSTSGMLQAYASVLDRRNNDLVQVSDDTPEVGVPAGTGVTYYISGVGRIEIPESNTHWRTDLSFYNPSASPRPMILEYHYVPAGATAENVVLTRITIQPGQVITADDIVGNDEFLDGATEDDLKTCEETYPCTILGLLKVSYNVPLDGAPLIIGGRIYADLSTGTAGMQLSTYTSDDSIAPGTNSVLVMPGAQTNLRFRTNVGIFTQGDEPTPVEIKAIRQDGSEAATFHYTLNEAGHSGVFAQIPITEDTFPGVDGNAMTIKVKALSGSPVGAYLVTVDQISTDTVFIQGKRVN